MANHKKLLEQAIKEAGSVQKLARQLGYKSRQTIYNWRDGEEIPETGQLRIAQQYPHIGSKFLAPQARQ